MAAERWTQCCDAHKSLFEEDAEGHWFVFRCRKSWWMALLVAELVSALLVLSLSAVVLARLSGEAVCPRTAESFGTLVDCTLECRPDKCVQFTSGAAGMHVLAIIAAVTLCAAASCGFWGFRSGNAGLVRGSFYLHVVGAVVLLAVFWVLVANSVTFMGGDFGGITAALCVFAALLIVESAGLAHTTKLRARDENLSW